MFQVTSIAPLTKIFSYLMISMFSRRIHDDDSTNHNATRNRRESSTSDPLPISYFPIDSEYNRFYCLWPRSSSLMKFNINNNIFPSFLVVWYIQWFPFFWFSNIVLVVQYNLYLLLLSYVIKWHIIWWHIDLNHNVEYDHYVCEDDNSVIKLPSLVFLFYDHYEC